ncbi:MAG TPA: nucleotide exchange factor GrpE [Candidatus Paceibacterota bacterium]
MDDITKNNNEPNDELESENSPPKELDVSDEAKELREKLELITREKDEYLNGWRRTKADFQNYKNEELKRLEEVIKFGNADIIKELITVLSNFDLAIAAAEKTGVSNEGIALIRSQLEEILKKRGLSAMEVKPGDAFSPALHEVLSEEEGDMPDGTIIEVLESGYVLQGKVIKPARVKLSKSRTEPSA